MANISTTPDPTHHKRPRHYAQEIVALPSLDERRAALLRVPVHFKTLIKAHLTFFHLAKSQLIPVRDAARAAREEWENRR